MSGTRVDEIRDREDFAAALTELRLRAGLSLRKIGQRVDRPTSTIHGWFTGRHLPYPRDNDLFVSVLEAMGIDDTASWMNALLRVRDGVATNPGLAVNPYRGLDSFGVDDADHFFGRAELVTDLIRRVETVSATDAPVLFVVGASGSGKSSVVHAGLLASLASSWSTVSLRPGATPLDHLDEGLALLDDTGPGRPRLIVVDQLEELFTLCDPDDRDRFVERLRQITTDEAPPTTVVLVIRSDFFGETTQVPWFAEVLQDHQVIIGPIGDAQLVDCITGPAAAVGATVDADLVSTLLKDLSRGVRQPAELRRVSLLPLLSEALFQTARASRGSRLTVSDYLGIGGVDGCVERSAEQAWARLSDAEQTMLRRLVPRLVNVQDDTVTRRPLRYTELQGLADVDGATHPDLIRTLAASRVLTATEDSVELTHEALLTSWPRLAQWIEEDRDSLRLQRQLADAAATWQADGRVDSDLLTGSRLELVRPWTDDAAAHGLNDLEADFLTRSAARADRLAQAERTRTRRLRIAVGVSVVSALLAAGLAVAANSARRSADIARDEALSRQLSLRSSNLRATDPSVSAQVAAAAAGVADTLEARSVLFEATAAPRVARLLGGAGPTALAVVPATGLAAIGNSSDGSIQLASVDDGTLVRRGLLTADDTETDLYTIAIDDDGGLLAAGGTDQRITLWDISDPDSPARIGTVADALPGAVFGLHFLPDSTHLAYAAANGSFGVLDIADPSTPLTIAEGAVGDPRGIAVSADGTRLATIEVDNTVALWTWADGRLEQIWTEPGDGATEGTSVAFSPDQTLFVAGDKSGRVRLWSLAGPEPEALADPPVEFTSWVNSLAFSADGRHLAAGSSDRSVRLWRTSTWTVEQDLELPDAVTQVVFDDQGDLSTVATDGGLRRWDLTDQYEPALDSVIWTLQFSGSGDLLAAFGDTAGLFDGSDPHNVSSAITEIAPSDGSFSGAGAISPDGTLLAIGGGAGAVEIHDITDPTSPVLLARLEDSADLIASIAFDGTGTRLAVGGNDQLVRLYDLTDPSAPAAEGEPITAAKDIVFNVAISPNGQLLAITGFDKLVHLLDISTPGSPEVLAELSGFTAETGGVAFSPDSTLLAVGSSDETTIVWDVSEPSSPEALGDPITGPEGSIFALTFDGDGRHLAAAVTDNSVWVWDLDDPTAPRAHARIESSDSQMFGIAFHPLTPVVAGAGADTDLRLWTVDRSTAIDDVCASVGDLMSADEWRTVTPDDRDLAACS